MAELPDLTVFAAILNRRYKGKTLTQLEVKVAKKINVTGKKLTETLEGKKLNEVIRDGKTLQLHFADHQVLGLHLMLRGELVLLDGDNTEPRFTILKFHFKGAKGFAVVDMQKMATPTLNPEKSTVPDALEVELAYFSELLGKKRTNIKQVLMDQQQLRGIGNSYADEILWEAKISPLSVANKIPAEAVKKLFKTIGAVLKKAIKAIEAENGDELRGELRDVMKVHGATIEKSPTGAKIKSVKIGGRTSYFTDEQEYYV